jgi:hypothetical protein
LTVVVVIRAVRFASVGKPHDESLLLLQLHRPSAPTEGASTATAPAPASRPHAAKRQNPPDNSITLPQDAPARPHIDWQRESEVVAELSVADAEKDANYRNLSGLSQEQLSWVQHNHMQPAPPGIPWHHPRFQFDKTTGLPIFWINDHCVLVTVFVFCGIGHIEADGELFKHMKDPKDP